MYLSALFASFSCPVLSMEQAAPASTLSNAALAVPYAISAGSVGAGALVARTIDKNQKSILNGLEKTGIFLFKTTPAYIQKKVPFVQTACNKIGNFLEPYNTDYNKVAAALTFISAPYLYVTIAIEPKRIAAWHRAQLPVPKSLIATTVFTGLITGSTLYIQSQLWEGKKAKEIYNL